MTDEERRGLLLEKYYQRRKERLIGLVPSDFEGQLNEHDILNTAGQLADHGLIHWRPNMGHGGVGGGMGTITAAGVDVVEGRRAPPVEIRFSRDRSLQLSASAEVAPAHDTSQGVEVAIERLARAIDASNASAADKRAATALLRAFQQHPLLRIIAQGDAEQLRDHQPKLQSETVNETTGKTR
jgi:hypothetical protein